MQSVHLFVMVSVTPSPFIRKELCYAYPHAEPLHLRETESKIVVLRVRVIGRHHNRELYVHPVQKVEQCHLLVGHLVAEFGCFLLADQRGVVQLSLCLRDLARQVADLALGRLDVAGRLRDRGPELAALGGCGVDV
eukprot:183558-Pyramimonas_sp.AAC.1